MITRRKLLRVTGVGCLCCAAPTISLAQPDRQVDLEDDDVTFDVPDGGCYLLPTSVEDSGLQLFSTEDEDFTTGDADLDKHLGQALVRISHFLNVRPAFGFYELNNAQASPKISAGVRGTWGTVLFGRSLFREEMDNHDKTGMTVLAIIAHEFSHILQYRHGLAEPILSGQPTVKRLELHADILAGFYLGARKRQVSSLSFYSAGEVFDRIGDSQFNDHNHHGTSRERVDASNFGFSQSSQNKASLEQMIQMATDYVKSV